MSQDAGDGDGQPPRPWASPRCDGLGLLARPAATARQNGGAMSARPQGSEPVHSTGSGER
jgi:hypothetical protein